MHGTLNVKNDRHILLVFCLVNQYIIYTIYDPLQMKHILCMWK